MIDKNIPLDNKVLDDIEIYINEGFDEETSNVLSSIFSIRSVKIMEEQDD
tara:strand:+ start:281 stop:430 length:150 start_codon:yes stop_codon:yes gene_type:complete